MSVVIALVRLRARQMNSGINRAPVLVRQLLRKSPDELSTTLRAELLRQNYHHFSTQLRVAAIRTLYRIPKYGPILGPRDSRVSRKLGRDQDFFINNIVPPEVRMRPIRALVTNPLSRTIRSCLYDAASLPSRKSLLFHHVDRHDAPPRIPLSLTNRSNRAWTSIPPNGRVVPELTNVGAVFIPHRDMSCCGELSLSYLAVQS
jgi:hypothetical protein